MPRALPSGIKELLDSSFKKFGKVYHINCHSMRCVAGKQSDDGAGSVRPDFVLGDRDGTLGELLRAVLKFI